MNRRANILSSLVAGVALVSNGSAESPLAKTQSSPLPVILSTDCGTEIDDQWTVIYLTISPEIRVLGFLGNHARNGLTGEKARDAILDVLENRLEMTDHPPVLAGSDGPIESRDKPAKNDAVRFLVEQSKAFSPTRRLTVLIIGSHTDVASAILSDRSIVQRIRVVMMGIDDWPGGGDPWNVRNDPEAARVVFDSGAPLAVGCGNVCLRDLSFTTESCSALLKGAGKVGDWLAKCFAEHVHRIDKDGAKVWPIWDNITAAHILGFTRTVERHRPRIAEDLSFDHSNPRGQLTWIESVETEQLWADFVGKLKAWENRKG